MRGQQGTGRTRTVQGAWYKGQGVTEESVSTHSCAGLSDLCLPQVDSLRCLPCTLPSPAKLLPKGHGSQALAGLVGPQCVLCWNVSFLSWRTCHSWAVCCCGVKVFFFKRSSSFIPDHPTLTWGWLKIQKGQMYTKLSLILLRAVQDQMTVIHTVRLQVCSIPSGRIAAGRNPAWAKLLVSC